MLWIEADIAVIRGRIRYGVRIPAPVDAYYDIVLIPGFSDTHAHPQVIDAGLEPGRIWSSSYEWLLTRNMVIDEASVRGDVGLSAMLAELALKRALLEGSTLIALTGSFEANIKAFTRMSVRPRTVLLPTVMKRRGWATPSQVAVSFRKYERYTRDDLLRLGIFVHSIAYGGPEMMRDAMLLASSIRGPLGIHLSEGVSERGDFLRYACCYENVRLVAVHCLNDDYRDLGIKCSSCPGSNITLYRRHLEDIGRATSFGSDWPHLLGTVGAQIGVITELYKDRLSEALYKATVGGYNDYLLDYRGDIVAYDGKFSDVIGGLARPRMVSVNNMLAVDEGRLVDTGENLGDILRATEETMSYAIEVHGAGVKPVMPSLEEVLEYARNARRRLEAREAR